MNPGAGRRRRSRSAALARLREGLAARDVEVCLTPTTAAGLAAARRAFGQRRGVLACGGDGTVRALAACAAEHDGLLAVVPTGAGNDFARALGLDHRRPLAALQVLDDGVETRVDLARATVADGSSAWYTTVAHSGLDGEVNRFANTVTWLSGTALYALAALRTMAVYRPTPMRVTVDGGPWAGDAWLVAVANTHCYGGGMRIAPTARITDGQLDVVIVGGVSRATVAARFPQMIRGRHLGVRGVETRTGVTVTVEGPPGQDLYASGERVGPLPARIEVVPGALRVLVPAHSPVLAVTTP